MEERETKHPSLFFLSWVVLGSVFSLVLPQAILAQAILAQAILAQASLPQAILAQDMQLLGKGTVAGLAVRQLDKSKRV